VVENGVAARRSFVEKNPSIARRFIRAAFEAMRTVYDNKELAMKTLAKYTKVADQKIVAEQRRRDAASSVRRPRRSARRPKSDR
jgi:ABC-type nitrate/sulfonate/bicarbonate transport system substrate-binding protein